MLTFFRHIRKSLLGSGQARKYLLYEAIGFSFVALTVFLFLQMEDYNERSNGGMKVTQHVFNATSDPVRGSCTIFSAKVGDNVLFGNNEDYYKPKTYLWTQLASEGNYGCIFIGYKDYSHQGGMNEKGLCFDANALPKSKINAHSELPSPPHYNPPYEDIIIWAPVLMLRKAASVEEALDIATKYNRKNWFPKSGSISYQINIADSYGDAAVISVDKSGELAFDRKKEDEQFLISTNYNKANPENALDYPCRRYNIAEAMLTDIQDAKELTVDRFKSILVSTHQKGIFSPTLYSNIFDLTNRILYLYHWHQFDEVVILKVDEELEKTPYMVRMKDLFSDATVNRARKEYIGSILLLGIGVIAGTGFMIFIIRYLKKRVSQTPT